MLKLVKLGELELCDSFVEINSVIIWGFGPCGVPPFVEGGTERFNAEKSLAMLESKPLPPVTNCFMFGGICPFRADIGPFCGGMFVMCCCDSGVLWDIGALLGVMELLKGLGSWLACDMGLFVWEMGLLFIRLPGLLLPANPPRLPLRMFLDTGRDLEKG